MVNATRVAVLDDDRAIRDLLEALLRDEGYDVVPVDPTGDPLEQLRVAAPDIIVLDWRVQHGDGAAFRAIRSDPQLGRTPVIVCTGDLEGIRAHARQLAVQPGVAIVEKPFSVDVLLAVIERAAAGSASEPRRAKRLPVSEELERAIQRGGAKAQARAVLRVFRAAGDWVCADLWLTEGGVLRCAAAIADERRRDFVTHSQATSLVSGFGLPGRVWVSRRPAWIEDVDHDRNFPRLAAAQRAGLHAAAGVPVVLGGAVVGVIAVYADRPRPVDTTVLQRLARMAASLGEWADRVRGDLLRPDRVASAARDVASRAARLADVAAVDLLSQDGQVYRVAVAHRDPSLAEVALKLEAFAPVAAGPVSRAIETLRAQRMAVGDATLRRWSGSPEHLLVLRALEMRSLAAVPLTTESGAFGALTLASADPAWHESAAADEASAIASGASRQLAAVIAKLARTGDPVARTWAAAATDSGGRIVHHAQDTRREPDDQI